MNMLALNKTFASIAIGFILVTSTIGCKKETTYIYEVDDVLVTKDQSEKTVSKTMVEFISIAYADVFGLTISQNDLGQLSLLYLAFGDKVLIEDVLVKNMLNSPEANLPSDLEMRSNIEVYVKNAYLKLYNREPNELENFTLTKKISDNPDMTSAMVYYAMMTSNEYRFY
jgi:hypothetical protein